MKRRITLSIVLTLTIVLITLMSSDSTAQAQNQMRLVADTGIVTLGPNQELRVVAGFDPGPLDGKFRFKQIDYAQGICSDGVCKHAVASQTTSGPVKLTQGEAVSFTCIPDSVNVVRVMVESNNRNVNVNGIVFDTSTQRVVSTIQISIQRENQ